MTSKIAFAAADAATSLKLQEKGVSKETLAMLAVLYTPIALVLPAVISKYTSSPRPLGPFLQAMPTRIAMNLVFSGIILAIPANTSTATEGAGGGLSTLLWGLILVCFFASQVVQNVMFVAQMAFFAKVADPALGGTYMTLLNTFANLGAKWPSTLVLSLIDVTTVPGVVDGYHVLNVVCTVVGVVWYYIMAPTVARLDALPISRWHMIERVAGGGFDSLHELC
eukprot:Tamp_14959.p1 GENE.Tamp_14959~~Tamp_14959.p1  ORF type:complete len:224 (+),score=24.80 Tamp_14959:86-757(+)